MMARWLLVLLALSVGINVGWAFRSWRATSEWQTVGPRAPAPEGRPGPGPGARVHLERVMEQHLDRMSEALGLTADQQAALRRVHDALFPGLRDAHRNVEMQRDAAARLFNDQLDDPDAFRRTVRDLQRSQARLDSLLTEVLIGEVAVLDHDQRARYIRNNPWSQRAPGAPPGSGGPPPIDGRRPRPPAPGGQRPFDPRGR